MTKILLLLCLLFTTVAAKSQNRNALVKALNNYVAYSNANVQGLSAAVTTMERYNGLFNDYLRKNRQLGGEAYEKPKPSPFLDEDMFTMGEDNPDFLYVVAFKGATVLPTTVRTDLNNSIYGMSECSQQIVMLLDSMSNIFSGPLIPVIYNPELPPYNLLYEAKQQLQLSKTHRDRMFLALNNYYTKACPLKAAKGDYIYSIDPLKKGVGICQNMLNGLSSNDSSHIAQYVRSLDSLHAYLEGAELGLLKGIKPFGDSKHFPNKGVHNGFDLYAKYENILEQLQVFSNMGKRFIQEPKDTKHASGKCYDFHKECTSHFNSILGLVYYYNEYALLIGGGKMKLDSDVGIIYKGWGDETHSLPVRTLLLWMKETPRFDVVFY